MAESKTTTILEEIKNLSVIELNELVKAIEEEFGVSAAAPVMMSGGGGSSDGGSEKSEFDIVLAEVGDKKMQVIKTVKEALGLGLKEAKEIVDSAPKTLKEKAPKEEAEQIKAKLEEVGAKVELK